MIEPRTIAEKLMYSTIRIETLKGRTPLGVGTAFFYLHKKGQTWLPVLIINKHVVKDGTHLKFRVHVGVMENGKLRPTGMSNGLVMQRGPATFFDHPDPNIDLCAMSAGTLQASAQQHGFSIFTQYLGGSNLPSESMLKQLDAVEDILMVG